MAYIVKKKKNNRCRVTQRDYYFLISTIVARKVDQALIWPHGLVSNVCSFYVIWAEIANNKSWHTAAKYLFKLV